ncbi:unnamed protein product [Camellia sinensis]
MNQTRTADIEKAVMNGQGSLGEQGGPAKRTVVDGNGRIGGVVHVETQVESATSDGESEAEGNRFQCFKLWWEMWFS